MGGTVVLGLGPAKVSAIAEVAMRETSPLARLRVLLGAVVGSTVGADLLARVAAGGVVDVPRWPLLLEALAAEGFVVASSVSDPGLDRGEYLVVSAPVSC